MELVCCEFCNQWFIVDDLSVEAYDYKNKNHMMFCPECGDRLLKHIDKMKKDIYGHKEESNEEQDKR